MPVDANSNDTIVRRLYEAHNTRNLAMLDDLFAPDYVNRTAPPGHADAAARKRQIAAYLAAAPDLHATIDDLRNAGDEVIVRWTTTATHTGAPLETPVGTIPANGAATRISGVDMLRIEDGRIAEEWLYFDAIAWLQQLGALPGITSKS